MKKFLSILVCLALVMSLSFSALAVTTVPLKSITLDKSTLALFIGKTYNLKFTLSPSNATNKAVRYSSSNSAVAKIDTKAKITAVSAGTATITVSALSNSRVLAKCKVTVTPSYGGVLKILMGTEAASLGFPASLASIYDFFTAEPAVESLGRYDGSGVVRPFLASSIDADADAQVVTVKLKKGIYFSDGTLLDADAVIWNWQQFIGSGRSELNSVDKFVKVDDYTILVKLKVWDNTIVDGLAYFGGYMISPTAYKLHGKDWCLLNPVGTGPFLLKSWDRGIKVTYTKNPNYWQKGQPYLDGIEFSIVKDQTTKASAFRSKEGDVLLDLSDSNIQQQLLNEGYSNITRVTGMGSTILGFMPNSNDPKSPFYDVKVRQAFCYAVDTKAIMKNMTKGIGSTWTNQWAAPGAFSFNKSVSAYPYNPAKAKQLLKEAGYPNGFTTTINTANNTSDVQACVILQGYLKEVGITATLNSMEQAAYNTMNGRTGTWDGIAFWASRGDPDTSITYPRCFTVDGTRFINGTPHPKDFIDLMANAKTAKTMTSKIDYCQQMSKTLIDKYAYLLPTYLTSAPIFTQSYVSGTLLGYNYYSMWSPETASIIK